MIRATRKDDLSAVFDLLKDAWVDTYVGLGLDEGGILQMFADKEAWISGFKQYLDSGHAITYVALEDENIIGIIFGRKGVIRSLYLKQGFQHKGYGSKLLKEFVKNGLPVRLDVLECNVRAQKFYEKHGFVPTGEFSYFVIGEKKYKDLEFLSQ